MIFSKAIEFKKLNLIKIFVKKIFFTFFNRKC